MRLTERDQMLLKKLGAARWLSTTQLKYLCFPDIAIQTMHRRLAILRNLGYITSRQANQMAEALHALGTKGRQALQEGGWPVKLERTPPQNLEHFLGINDIRVAVERSARLESVEIIYFHACWDLHSRIWPFRIIPDAVCKIGRSGSWAVALFEYDRGNERPSYILRTKLRPYAEGLEGFRFSRVVTIVDTAERLESLRDCCAEHLPDRELFRFLERQTLLQSWSVSDLLD